MNDKKLDVIHATTPVAMTPVALLQDDEASSEWNRLWLLKDPKPADKARREEIGARFRGAHAATNAVRAALAGTQEDGPPGSQGVAPDTAKTKVANLTESQLEHEKARLRALLRSGKATEFDQVRFTDVVARMDLIATKTEDTDKRENPSALKEP